MLNDVELSLIADKMVLSAVEDYKNGNNMTFFVMLGGGGLSKLESFPGAGHNYYKILEAIYRYHRLYPKDEINKMFYDTLSFGINLKSYVDSLNTDVNYLLAHLDYEKKNLSTFNLDVISLLKQLKYVIQHNEKLSQDSNAIAWFNNINNYVEQNYNKRI